MASVREEKLDVFLDRDHLGTISLDGDVYPCESFTNKLGNVQGWRYDLR